MCAQVHDGVVRLFPYVVLGGGNAAGPGPSCPHPPAGEYVVMLVL